VVLSAGVITADGLQADAPSVSNHGASGGGGGGLIYIVSQSITNDGSIAAVGGVLRAGNDTGGDGAAGAVGVVIQETIP